MKLRSLLLTLVFLIGLGTGCGDVPPPQPTPEPIRDTVYVDKPIYIEVPSTDTVFVPQKIVIRDTIEVPYEVIVHDTIYQEVETIRYDTIIYETETIVHDTITQIEIVRDTIEVEKIVSVPLTDREAAIQVLKYFYLEPADIQSATYKQKLRMLKLLFDDDCIRNERYNLRCKPEEATEKLLDYIFPDRR